MGHSSGITSAIKIQQIVTTGKVDDIWKNNLI